MTFPFVSRATVTMSVSNAPFFLQETRLNLDPSFPDAVVNVQIPSYSAFSRSSPKRRKIDRIALNHDEEAFSKYHLAAESSIHFRPKSRHHGKKEYGTPRAFLWRILEDRKLLELQAVDLYQESTEKSDMLLTLRFSFSSAIWPAGVAFAEQEGETGDNALVVFVMTKSGELFTLTLRKQHFAKPGLLVDPLIETRSWCTSATPNALNHRTPFRLLATSDRVLWVSIAEGHLVKLERKGDDGRLDAHSIQLNSNTP